MNELNGLLGRFAREGRVQALLLRPARDMPVRSVDRALLVAGAGIEGDRAAARASARPGGHKRQLTLIQHEHVPLIAAWCGLPALNAADLRRNVVVSGLNLLAARSPLTALRLELQLGSDGAAVELTGPCDPCSKMERVLGPGGLNAMRGHGGVTARVLRGGRVVVGDAVRVVAMASPRPD
jgi:MOSC domain-containing protein YiiM